MARTCWGPHGQTTIGSRRQGTALRPRIFKSKRCQGNAVCITNSSNGKRKKVGGYKLEAVSSTASSRPPRARSLNPFTFVESTPGSRLTIGCDGSKQARDGFIRHVCRIKCGVLHFDTPPSHPTVCERALKELSRPPLNLSTGISHQPATIVALSVSVLPQAGIALIPWTREVFRLTLLSAPQ
jgi:hypothetical protein